MSRYVVMIIDKKNQQNYEKGEFQDLDIKQHKGVTKDKLTGKIEYNGEHKCVLKLWSGSEKFEDIKGELS